MSFAKPNFFEVILIKYLEAPITEPFYRRYAESLGLKGDEKVLDFGSGYGGNARHIARILQKGDGRLSCVDISEFWLDVVKKKLKEYSNIDFKAGEISSLEIEDSCFDTIVVHFTLHDIEEDSRQEVARALARKLKDTGRLFIREPTKKKHGMQPEEIRELMTGAGLKETWYNLSKAMLSGLTYAGIYVKQQEKG